MLQLWMFLTPVIYPTNFIKESWQWIMNFNPMYVWIKGIRACFLGQPIDQSGLVISLLLSILIFIIGLVYFERAQRRFADII